MKTSRMILVLVSVGLLFLHAAGTMAATNTLYDYSFGFGVPPSTHINPVINLGDTVTWVWTNTFHSSTAASGQLESRDSHVQTTIGATFSHTFSNLGVYNYYCTVHGTNSGCRGDGS